MIAFFPAFYPDELVFSACSRYHERMSYRSSYCTGRDLFGVSTVRIAVDLPNRLEDLSNVLPVGHSYTADRLLTQHTLFPIYTAFESAKRASRLGTAMRESGPPVHAFAGALTIKLRSQFLRFCAECAAEDRKALGETYWHRVHNVTGVEVCPTHNSFLIESCVPIRRHSNLETFVTAESTIPTDSQSPKRTYYQTYSVLARELFWLLNHGTLSCDHVSKHNRYLRLLYENGFATFSGILRGEKIEAALRASYPADLLRGLQSEVDRQAAWIRSVIRCSARGGQAPYRHILILNLLGCSVEQFFALPETSFAPFGSSPWPCLNRAADHFRQPVVTKCRVRMATDGSSRPLGYFSCECEFVYARLGPDKSPEDRFRYHRVRAYGSLWRDKMESLLLGERRSRKEAAAELGVSTVTIKNVMEKLPGSWSPSWKISPAKVEERRAKWEETVKEHPDLSRNRLRQIAGNVVYDTLRRYDREWLELHSPPKALLSNGTKGSSNWPERDRNFAAKVPTVVAEVIKIPGKPIRYSATRIARRLGALHILHKRHPDVLPLTRAAIAEAAESVIDFAIRRVYWASDTYRLEGIAFNFAQLKARSGLSCATGKNAKVVEVITTLVSGEH